jgi:hypothetical protein
MIWPAKRLASALLAGPPHGAQSVVDQTGLRIS